MPHSRRGNLTLNKRVKRVKSFENELQSSMTASANFNGARVLALESRRAEEMRTLIESFGGQATVAPSMREVPLENNAALLEFITALHQARVDELVCMTGVGTRFLLRQLEPAPGALEALKKVNLVLRSGKAVPVLRERGLTGTLVRDPHTWHEVLAHYQGLNIRGKRVWIAEFGDDAPKDFIAGLELLGASVDVLPVYRWALPEDTAPLEEAIGRVAQNEFDWLLLTSGVQLWHAVGFARSKGLEGDFRAGLARLRIASIGPSCNEAMQELGFQPAVTADPHKMGVLVRVAAINSGSRT
jgi:uroporphyrinogen-III synthase